MFFILGLLNSTALFGFFSLIISFFFSGLSFFEMIGMAFHPESLKEVFISYMIWSLPIYVVLMLIHIGLVFLSNRFHRNKESFSVEMVFSFFIADFTNPFRGLFSLIGARKVIDSRGANAIYPWFQVILHFVWSILLFVWIGIGFFAILN